MVAEWQQVHEEERRRKATTGEERYNRHTSHVKNGRRLRAAATLRVAARNHMRTAAAVSETAATACRQWRGIRMERNVDRTKMQKKNAAQNGEEVSNSAM